MGIVGRMQVVEPDKVLLSATITMALGQWKELVDMSPDRWPASELKDAIYSMVRQVDTKFFPGE